MIDGPDLPAQVQVSTGELSHAEPPLSGRLTRNQMPEELTFPVPIRLLPRPLVETDGRESRGPFIRFLSDAHPLRAYLACLEVDGRVVVPHLTILMEPNEYPGSRTSGAREPMGNRQLEQIWRRGLVRHRKLKSRSIAATDERALPAGALDGDPPRHAPQSFPFTTDSDVHGGEQHHCSGVTRVALYVRVSTNDQRLDLQLDELRQFCKRRGWLIAGEFSDLSAVAVAPLP